MYECGKLKKVIGNKILFQIIIEQCALENSKARFTMHNLDEIGNFGRVFIGAQVTIYVVILAKSKFQPGS